MINYKNSIRRLMTSENTADPLYDPYIPLASSIELVRVAMRDDVQGNDVRALRRGLRGRWAVMRFKIKNYRRRWRPFKDR